jgi:hypothetical protein
MHTPCEGCSNRIARVDEREFVLRTSFLHTHTRPTHTRDETTTTDVDPRTCQYSSPESTVREYRLGDCLASETACLECDDCPCVQSEDRLIRVKTYCRRPSVGLDDISTLEYICHIGYDSWGIASF